MSTALRALVRAMLVVLAVPAVFVIGPAGVAMAAAPNIAIDQPASGISTNNQTPLFSGTTDDILDPVTLEIYEGGSATGSPVQTLGMLAPVEIAPLEGSWEVTPTMALAQGQYTAVAEQTDTASEPPELGTSAPVTFTVDTTPPAVSIEAVPSPTKDAEPTLTGDAGVEAGDDATVAVKVYQGETVGGAVVQSTTDAPVIGGEWSYTVPRLADGTYTAQAEQADEAGNTGTSAPVTFTVDTTPPKVTLTSPAHGSSESGSSQAVSGSAGTAEGDQPGITIQLFAGSTTTGQALEAITVQASKGGWSATFGGLNPGTYTARAEQRDDAGNIGYSAPATFTLTAAVVMPPTQPSQPETTPMPPATTPEQSPPAATPSTQSPPAASFQWFPSAPHTGESISLVSTSTDAASPIAGFAWSLAGNGVFNTGAPAITAAFAAPGDHVVQLRVTGADGLTSVATETIPVTSPVLTLMQPFPVVRIAGSDSSSGARISLLTVEAPVGTQVEITCRGHHCPSRSESRVVVASRGGGKAGTVVLTFARFERSLQAGVVLEIRVSKQGEIGKYTSFAIRRGRLPVRVDACVEPADPKPISCPAS